MAKVLGRVRRGTIILAPGEPTKPRSWGALEDELNRAANAGIIKKGVVTNVLNEYRLDNQASLGYAEDSCLNKAYACTVPVAVFGPVEFINTRPVRKKQVADTRHFEITVQARNAVLMSNETDFVQVTINEFGRVVETEVMGSKNRYAVSSGPRGEVILTGNLRMKSKLLARSIREDGFDYVGATATFMIEMSPDAIPNRSEDPNAQLIMNYTLSSCKHGTFGGCAWSRDEKIESKGSAIVTDSKVQIPVVLSKKRLHWIDYTLSRSNSLFFEPNEITRQTDSLVGR